MSPYELIVDSFAGGGGASEGIRLALGRSPDIAINHDKEAIALHQANHPESLHLAEDVWQVDPVQACGGRPVGLMWLSPDCKHFSKAKGGKPVSKKIRGLAWVAIRWAAAVRPRVIVLENVEEFQTWGPVLRDSGMPCKARRGQTFKAFVRKLTRLGYAVQWRELRGCDFGAPTIRKRLFLVARCDGQPIVWPAPTHGKGRPNPWRTAAECIDWSIPCHSIFLTKDEGRLVGVKRPLAPATMRRIARGVKKFVIDNPRPFIVSLTHQGDDRIASIDEPMRTITSAQRGERALVAPFLKPRYGEDPDPSRRGGLGQAPRVRSLKEPMPVIVPTGNGGDLVATFMAQHNTDNAGHQMEFPVSTIVGKGCTQGLVAAHIAKQYGDRVGSAADEPLHTVVANGVHHALVASHIKRDFGTSTGAAVDSPLPTITSDGGGHASLVASFLMTYYGTQQQTGDLRDPSPTIMAKDRFALVTVNSVEYVIVDIGMRMLVPRELYRAQGFDDSYRIDVIYNGKPLTKTAQVRMVGNSVSPLQAKAIVAANCGAESEEATAA